MAIDDAATRFAAQMTAVEALLSPWGGGTVAEQGRVVPLKRAASIKRGGPSTPGVNVHADPNASARAFVEMQDHSGEAATHIDTSKLGSPSTPKGKPIHIVHGDDGSVSVGWNWPSRGNDWGAAADALRDAFNRAKELLHRPEDEAKQAGKVLLGVLKDAAKTAYDAAKAAGDAAKETLGTLKKDIQRAAVVASIATPLAVVALLYLAGKSRGLSF